MAQFQGNPTAVMDNEVTETGHRRASTIEELKQMMADFEAGLIEATPWEDVKREMDAIRS